MRQQSVISTTSSKVDPGLLGEIKIKDMNILLFTHIGGKFIKNSTSLEELSQYIDIFYNNARTDSSGATNERIEVKRCTS